MKIRTYAQTTLHTYKHKNIHTGNIKPHKQLQTDKNTQMNTYIRTYIPTTLHRFLPYVIDTKNIQSYTSIDIYTYSHVQHTHKHTYIQT